MSDKHYIRSCVPVRVVSVYSPESNPKVKLIEVHPLKPWVIIADSIAGKVMVYDYFNKKCLSDEHFSLYSTEQPPYSTNFGGYDIRKFSENELLFRRNRLKYSTETAPGCFSPYVMSKVGEGSITGGGSTENMRQPVVSTVNASSSRVRSLIGTIRKVLFTDFSAVKCYSRIEILSSSNPTLHDLYDNQRTSSIDNDENANIIGIAVVCEFNIVFHDMLTKKNRSVSINDLLSIPANMTSNLTITSAGYVQLDVLIVGINDGGLRVWDVKRWKSLKAPVTAHNRSTDVVSIKSILSKRYG